MITARFKKTIFVFVATFSLVLSSQVAVAAPTVSVAGVTPGANTFISFVDVNGFTGSTLRSISFRIAPQTNATAVAMQATYSSTYLKNRNYLNSATGVVRVPIYGLYQSYNNQVSVTYNASFGRGTLNIPIQTNAWDNGCNSNYSTHTDVVARNKAIKLNYSYFMLKGWACNAHPVVLDTDGQVRWAGTAGNGQQGSSFVGNSMYLGSGSQLFKMELDGTYAQVGDYSAQGYNTFHHNIDPGKTGLLLDLNHNSDVEANIIEVSRSGAIIKEWDLGAIIEQAMSAGKDDPSGFVNHNGYDWFHNNAATYWPQRNELVVSSRENFVIGIGYDDKKIKWILGDPDKAWYQYASLRAFALTLPVGTHPPIGNHAVSITSAGNLMLFDNGYQSFAHNPSGSSRGYSAPRQYTINERTKVATEIWNFEHGQTVWSPICSSIYQDGSSYLIDYASEDGGIRLVGLDARSNIGFEWKLPGTNFVFGWNALPIHIENLSY